MAPTQNEAQAAPKPLAATFDGKSYLITKPGTFSLASWKVSYEGKTLDCQGNSVAGCVSAIETYEEIQATGIVDSGAVKLNTKADPKKAFVSGGDDDGGR